MLTKLVMRREKSCYNIQLFLARSSKEMSRIFEEFVLHKFFWLQRREKVFLRLLGPLQDENVVPMLLTFVQGLHLLSEEG